MKITNLKYPLAVLAITLAAVSCKKDSTTTNTESATAFAQLTTDKTKTDVLIDDTFGEIMAANQLNGMTNQPSTPNLGCYAITIWMADVNTWPREVTLDYGYGCTGASLYMHKGKIHYTISDKFSNTGATITATFENYTVNEYKIEGTYVIRNNGSANGWNLTDSLKDGKVTYPDGTTWFTKTGTRTMIQTAGQNTLVLTDDEFDVTGNGVIKNSAGHTLTASTQTPIHRTATCLNAVSGKLSLTFDSLTGLLDFGTGECDNQATLTIGTKTYPITLP